MNSLKASAPEGASIIGEIFEYIDQAEADQRLMDESDPNLEETFASMIDDVVNHPGQISDQINSKISGLENTKGALTRSVERGHCVRFGQDSRLSRKS